MRSCIPLKLCVLTLFLTFACAFPASAWEKDAEPRGSTAEYAGNYATNLISIVENLAWSPEGKDNGKYLYVFFAPGCSFSREFFGATRKGRPEDIQIRWVPVDFDGDLNSMLEERTANIVAEAFLNSRLPVDKDAKTTAAINQYHTTALLWLLVGKILSPDGSLYYPTFVYGTPEKAFVSIGPVENLAKLFNAVPSVEPKKDFQAEALRYPNENIEIIPIPSLQAYKNESGGDIVVRLTPSPNGVKIGGIPNGVEVPLPPLGVTRNGYVVLDFSGGQNTRIFIEDEALVQRVLSIR